MSGSDLQQLSAMIRTPTLDLDCVLWPRLLTKAHSCSQSQGPKWSGERGEEKRRFARARSMSNGETWAPDKIRLIENTPRCRTALRKQTLHNLGCSETLGVFTNETDKSLLPDGCWWFRETPRHMRAAVCETLKSVSCLKNKYLPSIFLFFFFPFSILKISLF